MMDVKCTDIVAAVFSPFGNEDTGKQDTLGRKRREGVVVMQEEEEEEDEFSLGH